MKRVYASFNATVVHHLRNLLETEGVETEVRNAILSSAVGELPAMEVELWVDEQDLQKAEAILNRKPSGQAWRCRCGETLGGQFTQCWNCGEPAPS